MQTVAPRYVSGESRTRTSTPKGCTPRRGKRTVLRGGYRRGARPLPTRTRPQPAAGVTARVVEASAPEQASYTSEERLQALESAVSSGTRVACPPGPRPAKRMATPSQVRGGDDQQTGLPPRHKGQLLGPPVSAPSRSRTIPGPTTPTSHTWSLSIQVSDVSHLYRQQTKNLLGRTRTTPGRSALPVPTAAERQGRARSLSPVTYHARTLSQAPQMPEFNGR
jgi:hypothetical protein